jgi:hypothetical protein
MAETKLSKHIRSNRVYVAVQLVSAAVALELGYLNSFSRRANRWII